MATVVYNSTFAGETLNQPPANTTARWSTGTTTNAVRAISSEGFSDDRSFEFSSGSGNAWRLRTFDAANNLEDVQLETSVRITNADFAGPFCVLRGSGSASSENGYLLLFLADEQEVRLIRISNGSGAIVRDAAFSYGTNDFIHIDFQAEGDTVTVFAWKNAESKPGSPVFAAYQDGSPFGAGFAGVGIRSQNQRVDYDSLTLTNLAEVSSPLPTNVDVLPTPGLTTTHLRVSWDDAAANGWQIRFDTEEFDPAEDEGTQILEGAGTLDGSRRHFDHQVPDPNPAIDYHYDIRSFVD